MKTNWKPNKWLALGLGVLGGPVGIGYAAGPLAALAALAAFVAIASAAILYAGLGVAAVTLLAALAFAAFAFVLAWKAQARAVQPAYARWYGVLAMFAAYALINVLMRAVLFEPFRMPAFSMHPTIPVGSMLVVKKWGYGRLVAYGINFGNVPAGATLERGDLIVFDYPRDPAQTYIKRLAGLPGDRIVYRDRRLHINGVAVPLRPLADYLDPEQLTYFSRYEEKLGNNVHEIVLGRQAVALPYGQYFSKPECLAGPDFIECSVPEGHYFVLGDNRDNSNDSRFWGLVARDAIMGKVVAVAK